MTFHFRPETRDYSRLIIGLAGPTKSGKTMSAHRLAVGLAGSGQIVKINAEGPNGHLYADRFPSLVTDIGPPFRPARFTEALKAALELKPAVVIIDSASHMHDGPGGLLQYHEEELDRIAGTDRKKRERSTWAAWIKPKADENEFIYTMLGADCHIILAFRAKEKLKIVKGQEPIALGWQPIAGDRITFETIFTLTLPPHSKGVPELAASDMREPFDTMIPAGRQLDENLGKALARWASGAVSEPEPKATGSADRDPSSRSATPPVDAASGSLTTPELEAQLLAFAESQGRRDTVDEAITESRASRTADEHHAWLLKARAKAVEAAGGEDAFALTVAVPA